MTGPGRKKLAPPGLRATLVWTLLAAVAATACKSSGDGDDDDGSDGVATPRRGGSRGAALTQNLDLSSRLSLSKSEEQALYVKMLAVELNYGVQVAKDQVHTTRGLAVCRGDIVPGQCDLRVRLMADELSPPQPLPVDFAARLVTYARGEQGESYPVIVVDLGCDYLGKKSPPYDVEAVTCFAKLPRPSDEAVFTDKTAQELSEALRGEAPFGQGKVSLTGLVTCHQPSGSSRYQCVVRSSTAGVAGERLTELSPAAAMEVGRQLRQTYASHYLVARDSPLAQERELPPAKAAVAGAVGCMVDNTKVEAEGRRGYLCRVKI